jgi:hypothetical protein
MTKGSAERMLAALFVHCACALSMLSAPCAAEIEIRVVRQEFPLPQTDEMKLAGDPSSYVRTKCSGFSASCDVFVQGNGKGSLVGYLFIRQESDGSVYFESDALTDDGRVCVILGNFDGSRFEATEDFEQRSSFQSQRGKTNDGGYLIKRSGERLRVRDDKWNYCYDAKSIDDVWNLMGTARRR